MDKYQRPHLLRYAAFPHLIHNNYFDLLLSDIFRQLGLSLISLFVPIFLLESGFSLRSIAILEAAMFIGIVIAGYYILAAIPRWGAKFTLVMSYASTIVFYILLYNLVPLRAAFGTIGFLVLSGLFNVLSIALYWSAHHVAFLCSTEPGQAGARDGLIVCIPGLLSVGGLYVGSLLITAYGFDFVFLLASALIIAAGAALMLSGPIRVASADFNWKAIIDRGHREKNAIYFLQGISFGATGFLWPVYMFISAIKLAAIGGLYLISETAYYLVALLAGRRTDHKRSRPLVAFTSLVHGLTIIMRAISVKFGLITFWQTLGGTFGGVLHLTLESEFFKHAGRDHLNAIMNRELYMHAGRFLIMAILITGLSLSTPKIAFVTALIGAGVATALIGAVSYIFPKKNS